MTPDPSDPELFDNSIYLGGIHGDKSVYIPEFFAGRSCVAEDRSQPQRFEFGSREDDAELVFALCHELGNLMGAVRLHAHVIDEDMGRRELARTSVDLDDLSARASALLGLVRPLLSTGTRSPETVSVASVIQGVEGLLAGYGGRGAGLVFELQPDLPGLRADVMVLQRLLQSFVYMGLEAASGHGEIGLRAELRGDRVVFLVEDDAPVDEDPSDYRNQVRRGRPLLCAIAERIMSKQNGAFEVNHADRRTMIDFSLPAIGLRER
jgi:hypothetical protein